MFGSYFTAYYRAEAAGNYTFQITTRQSVMLYLDSDRNAHPRGSEHQRHGPDLHGRPPTLQAGYHFIRIMWADYASDPRLEVSVG